MATPSWFHHGAVVVVLWTNAPVVLSAPIRAAPVRSLPRAVPPLRSAPRTLFLGVAKRRGDGDDDPPASVQAGFRVWRPIPSKRVSEGGPSLRAAFAFSVLVLLIPANVPHGTPVRLAEQARHWPVAAARLVLEMPDFSGGCRNQRYVGTASSRPRPERCPCRRSWLGQQLVD